MQTFISPRILLPLLLALKRSVSFARPKAVAGRPAHLSSTKIGGAERDRTADPLLAKQVLSQLSYSPNRFDHPLQASHPGLNQNGGPGQTRTADLTLIRRAL